ncbi:MAG: adenosylcobinamide-phosphate synthase CbiB [Acidimicrobiales bacterium]
MSNGARRAGAVAIGLAVDRLAGEPPARFHPVARFGTAMDRAEGRLWADQRGRGLALAATGVGAAAAMGWAAEWALGDGVATAAAVSISSAGLALTQAADAVAERLRAGDLAGARAALPALVGRDSSELDEKEIARAVVESVAENLSDAVVATALWGLLGGAPLAFGHRAANTLDAMVGHRTSRHARFGWASARLDDLLGWPAARATAVLVAVAAPGRAGAVWRACRRDAPQHPSPNAGVAEAAFAAALDLRLGGVNRYGGRVELRAPLGEGAVPGPADIDRAVALARRTTMLLLMALLAGWATGWLGQVARGRGEP